MTETVTGNSEQATSTFFDRPVNEVVLDLSEREFIVDTPRSSMPQGQAKVIVVDTPEGEKQYKIILAEAYRAEDAINVWSGKRMELLRSLAPGELIGFKGRMGMLPFIKTQGADNIQLREIVDVNSGQKFVNSKQVALALGLANHNDTGRLVVLDDGRLKFEKVG